MSSAGVYVSDWLSTPPGSRGEVDRSAATAPPSDFGPELPAQSEEVKDELPSETPPITRELPIAADDELPTAYFGDVMIRGTVAHADGAPAVGAAVSCMPMMFVPFTDRQRSRFVTTADEQGRFEFSKMPQSSWYEVRATQARRFARLRVALEDARTREISLRMPREVYYERYEFVDSQGEPIRLRNPVGVGRGVVLATSRSASGREVLDALGLAAQWTRGNIVVNLYDTPRHFQFEGQPIEYYVREPGYLEVALAPHRKSVDSWPGFERVILAPDNSQLVYQIAIPPTEVPSDWPVNGTAAGGLHGLTFRVSAKQRDKDTILGLVHKSSNVVAALGDAPIELRILGAPHFPIPYAERRDGRVVHIRPRMPATGYLSISYRVPDDVSPLNPTVNLQLEDEGGTWPVLTLYPGYAIAGPLPTGEYTLRKVWASGTEGAGKIKWRSGAMKIDVAERHEVIEWR
jgi:hypothetical protein